MAPLKKAEAAVGRNNDTSKPGLRVRPVCSVFKTFTTKTQIFNRRSYHLEQLAGRPPACWPLQLR